MITKLMLRDFKGAEEGEIGLGRVSVFIGANNSGKTTVLEAFFLAPNPLRVVPYGVNVKAVQLLSALHQTLSSKGYLFILHNYTSEIARIRVRAEEDIEVIFHKRKDSFIDVYMAKPEKGEAMYLGQLNKYSDDIGHAYPGLFQLRNIEEYRGYEIRHAKMEGPYQEIGEALLYNHMVLDRAWNFIQQNWIEFSKYTVDVAGVISENLNEQYSNITLEPFGRGTMALYFITDDGRRIRLGDVGEGVKTLATLFLLAEYTQPRIILIDDVEAHMNPAALYFLANWLADKAENGVQVVVSTHSIEAAKTIAAVTQASIHLLSLKQGKLYVKRLTLDELEHLETLGIDARTAEGILI